MAVRVGFEPTERLYVHLFLRPDLSTTQHGKAIIIAADNDFKNLLHSKCVYSIKYFKDTFFSIMKCKVNDIALRRLKNIKEIADE